MGGGGLGGGETGGGAGGGVMGDGGGAGGLGGGLGGAQIRPDEAVERLHVIVCESAFASCERTHPADLPVPSTNVVVRPFVPRADEPLVAQLDGVTLEHVSRIL